MAKLCPVCGKTYPDASAFCAADGTTLISEQSSGDLVGSVVADRYLVERLLGEGGMGRVYLARHVRLPQQAAIKVLHPGMVSDPEAVARFNREAANAARIEHDRVARVFDFGETRDGSVYLAMEYVPGRSLHSIVGESGRLAPARAARIIHQVAEGLEAAHRIGIVHRDLKPDNIMVVTDEAGVDRCKVVDFGIAKAADGPSRTRLTRTGMIVGTPEFMSPEQFLGEELDARSDVYALALVAYNVLTGTMPFVAATPERAMAARMMEAPRPLAVADPATSWPAALQQVLDRGLARDPSERVASAIDFADDLVAAVEAWTGEPVLRARTPLASRAVTPPSLTAISAPAGAPSASGASSSATPTVPAVPVAPSGRGRGALIAAAVAVLAAGTWYVALRGSEPPVGDGAGDGMVAVTSSPQSTDSVRGGAAAPIPTPAAPSKPAAPSAEPPAVRETTSVEVTAAPPVTGTTPEGALALLDSLQEVLRDDASGAAEAGAALVVLERLLPRMATATDSTWTYLALANAHGQAGSPSTRACAALRQAQRLAATAAQRAMVGQLFDSPALACVR